jgi:dTDP-4-dehydrorhamnose reductase
LENHAAVKKILLLGAGGLMGGYLHAWLSRAGAVDQWQVCGLSRAELDVTDEKACLLMMERHGPDLVLNAAAFCRMEACEKNPDYSRAVNALAPRWWAEACAQRKIPLVHLSTDYVFGGTKTSPYREADETEPLSIYAQHKREGECAVLAQPRQVVLRLAWIFGVGGATFMSRIPELLAKEEVLTVALGRTGACLYAGYGAQVLELFLEKMCLAESGVEGLYHLTQRGELSWLDFALECRRQMRERGMPVRNTEIRSVPLESHGALEARRPSYTVLDLSKTEALLGRELAPWQHGLATYLEELAGR